MLLPPQLPLEEDLPRSMYQDIHRLPISDQDLYCHFPEEIYLSSVLPTRTPRELRHFQDQCWRTYQGQEGLEVTYNYSIQDV